MNLARRAHASFTISGDQVLPNSWTDYFGVAPDLAISKGDPIPDPTGQGRNLTRRTGVWSVSSKDKIVGDELEPHLRYLIERLELPRDDFRKRVDRENASVRLFCYWYNDTGNRVPHIPDDIRNLCEIEGIEIDIDEHR
ncbi:DUF4279 domain-containing protein [Paraburkholderia sp. 2C]